MGLRLLVVEDDDRIRAALRLGLEDEGYEVTEAPSGELALELVGTDPPDVMLVDLMLGGIDGLTCIRQVRAELAIPIIVVSARGDTHDVVAGLEAGADDYVTKPFHLKELSARLRALRRRIEPIGGDDPSGRPGPLDIVLDGSDPTSPLVLSRTRGILRRGREAIHLTVTEFRLLGEFAAAPGRILTRSVLLDTVWQREYSSDDRILDVHVRRLRRKIERDPKDPKLLITLRGMGYRFDPQ